MDDDTAAAVLVFFAIVAFLGGCYALANAAQGGSGEAVVYPFGQSCGFSVVCPRLTVLEVAAYNMAAGKSGGAGDAGITISPMQK